jgi:hypothetical protein
MGRSHEPVNMTTTGDSVNRGVSGLSKQQRDILDVIARLKRSELGTYHVGDITREMEVAGDRPATASISRAVIRLEGRGLLCRHHQHGAGNKHGFYLFTLTEVGLRIVNELRQRHGLGALEMIHYAPKPPITNEEFRAKMEAIRAEVGLLRAKDAAGELPPERLKELRNWIDSRLAEGKAAGEAEVNTAAGGGACDAEGGTNHERP